MGLMAERLSLKEALQTLSQAAVETDPVAGLTHRFYRYPARFSPAFAGAAIDVFSQVGDVVLDPFMGGGTTVVEASAKGRRAVGCDLNPLATFISRVKTTPLSEQEIAQVKLWAHETVRELSYRDHQVLDSVLCSERTRNLNLPVARPTKKILSLALLTLSRLPTERSSDFARCVLLNVGQWALDNRKKPASLGHFRREVSRVTETMLQGLEEFSERRQSFTKYDTLLDTRCASEVTSWSPFRNDGLRADLVVTSPPYPGINVLYHRWQIGGRRETPAPYWLSGCQDGHGTSYFTFGDRRRADAVYFQQALSMFTAIRDVMKDDGLVVQMLAFSEPVRQLPRYLRTMERAGFVEVKVPLGKRFRRIRRSVPGRRWQATLKGELHSAREVVLVHRTT